MLQKIADCIYGLLYPVSRYEDKLRDSGWYRKKTVSRWKRQLGFSSSMTNKILEQIKIFTQPEIQQLIKQTVFSRPDIFNYENCYIMRFGEPGKSGEMIIYHFRRSSNSITKFENLWEIPNFPSESRVVFVDDIIGTGNQSLEIIEFLKIKVSSLFKSSHRPYLFTICGTPKGINNVREQTTFEVVCAFPLEESKFNFYHESNTTFSEKEKKQMMELNQRLGEKIFFAQGLLVAFYYTTPDNSMHFIWNDECRYHDTKNRQKTWFALLPRNAAN